jgi:hypothetical protein
MGLLDTPSGGQSEVLETLHYEGAIASGVPLYRLGPMVSHRWGGDETRAGSDPDFEADLLTVLNGLEGDGYVVGRDADGNSVELAQGTEATTTRIVLTAAGREAGRHPRPRPVRIFD